MCNPFLTVQHGIDVAYTAVTDVTTRPCVYVMPGTYTENCVLKANILVRGLSYNSSRIIGNWTIDNTFTPAGDWRSGFADIGIFGTLIVDFLAVGSPEGKLFVWNSRLSGGTTLIANNNPINQFLMFGGEIFGGYTQTGLNGALFNVIMQSGAITLNAQAGQSPSFRQVAGVRQNTQINAVIGLFSAVFQGTVNQGSTLTINGTNATVVASSNALPLINLITYAGGATPAQITRLNDVFGEAYTPAVPANWTPVPTTAQEALDQIAVRLVAGGL